MPHDVTVDLARLADQEGVDPSVDPYALYTRLREAGPVHRVRLPVTKDECWLVVGHREARAALVDERLSNDVRLAADPRDDGSLALGRNMLQVDAVEHGRLRRLVAGVFTARRVRALRPRVQQLANELVTAFLDGGSADEPVDLVAALALPLPMAVICELMGVADEDREDFHRWSDAIVKPPTPDAAGAALHSLMRYFATLIENKRRHGGDDLLSALVRANDTGDHTGDDGSEGGAAPAPRLSDDDLLGMVFLLFVAGHETSANLIAAGVHALLRHPRQLAELRADWSLLDGAVEEMLRYCAPVQATAFRFTSEPVTVAGTELPAGAPVLVSLGAVSRDPELFPAPDAFDIRRPPSEVRTHLAFGHGAHYCIGAPLARLEASLAIRTLLERCPRLRLAPEGGGAGGIVEEVVWRPNAMLRGLDRLPVLRG
ncbi:cytochrome P450 [Streptomyces sp. NPDC047315]|uniref:cytochrome P450 family protein n=1 Tax=Streptomyces sp. NPDC047315 TaxID=3155142 RepID=UPI0033FFE774